MATVVPVPEPVVPNKVQLSETKKVKKKPQSQLKKGQAYKDVDLDALMNFTDDFMAVPAEP